MLSKAIGKHKHVLTSELPFSTVKRCAGHTSFLQGGCIYLSALSDAMVMSVMIEDLRRLKCAVHPPSKRWAGTICAQHSYFLPLKVCASGWLSPISSICWCHRVAVVKGTEVLPCWLQGPWKCSTVLKQLHLLANVFAAHLAVWCCWRMPLRTEIHLVLVHL